MKKDLLELKDSDKLEVAEVKPVETHKLFKSVSIHPGHKTWELNLDTCEITEANIERVDATIEGSKRSKVIMKPNCLYCTALNQKNADKKFIKMIILSKMLQS